MNRNWFRHLLAMRTDQTLEAFEPDFIFLQLLVIFLRQASRLNFLLVIVMRKFRERMWDLRMTLCFYVFKSASKLRKM